jgi:GNAT superfamily N-acetyltransferase
VLADFDDGSGIEIETMNTRPLRQTGLGTEVMKSLGEYCRPRGVRIYVHAVAPAVAFYQRFQWLRQDHDESGELTRDFHSTWADDPDQT